MRNGTVFLKSTLLLPALALATAAFFSSCQKTSTTDTNIGDWAKVTEFKGQPRTQAVSFTIGDTAYIGAGLNGVTGLRLQDFYKFDESHNQTWIQVAPLPFPGHPRSGAVGFSVGGFGYVVGGFDGTNYLYDVWQYNPQTNSWLQKNDVTVTAPQYVSTVSAFGFTLNDKGYIGGGADSTQQLHGDVYQYDYIADTWTEKASIFTKCTGASCFVYKGLAYVVGGAESASAGGYSPDLAVYDPNAGNWSKRRKIVNDGDSAFEANYGVNITRSNAALVLINDTAYLTTGNTNGVIGTTWAYDIGQDLWFQKTSFEGVARQNAIGFSVNNHGYVATGDNGSSYFDDVWQFYPDAAQTNNNNY